MTTSPSPLGGLVADTCCRASTANNADALGSALSPKLKVLDLFSGIGGFSLGLERTGGFETVAFCEIEDFPRRVLAKHWPDVPCYRDVRELTGERLAADGIAIDVICGGFPCQDISTSGRQAGISEGTRSGLWSEIVRLVREIRPSFLVVENVANLLAGPSGQPGGWFGRILGDLAEVGFGAEWHCIPASRIGGTIRRDRVWIIAFPDEAGHSFHHDLAAGADELRARPPADFGEIVDCGGFGTVLIPSDIRVEHGISGELVMSRIGALGNAVVPQIPELIGHAILQSLNDRSRQEADPLGAAQSGFIPFHNQPNSAEAQHDHA